MKTIHWQEKRDKLRIIIYENSKMGRLLTRKFNIQKHSYFWHFSVRYENLSLFISYDIKWFISRGFCYPRQLGYKRFPPVGTGTIREDDPHDNQRSPVSPSVGFPPVGIITGQSGINSGVTPPGFIP
jgi:hypothetical protein